MKPSFRVVERSRACPTGPGNPRNSEADLILEEDGALFLTFTEFSDGAGDFDRSRIALRTRTDRGPHWSPSRLLLENPTGLNAMCPSLLDLGPIRLLLYLRKNALNDCRGWLAHSSDRGTSWREEETLITQRPGYWVIENGCLRLLPSGRLITAGAFTQEYRSGCTFRSIPLFSDDQGTTWSEGEPIEIPAPWGALEPEVAALPSGDLVMLLRTSLGGPWICHSSDEGATWSRPHPTGLRSPNSPHTVTTAPDGSLLLLYNDSDHLRTPLSIARSTDGGISWLREGDLDSNPDRRFGYPSCTWDGDRLLATWYEAPPGPPPGNCEIIYAQIHGLI